MRIKNGMRPVHPGEVLRQDFLVPAGMTANALAKALLVPAPRVNDSVRERRGITVGTAMRLARYSGDDAPLLAELSCLLQFASCRDCERPKDRPRGHAHCGLTTKSEVAS